MSERELVKKDITDKIDEFLVMNNMSVVNGKIALGMLRTFIKYMDED